MNDQSNFQSTPAILRVGVMAISILVALSSLPWLFMAVGQFGGFAWGLFGFELIMLLGCIMTLLVCIGKVRVENAFPVAIACLVGTILVGMVFGIYVDARALVGDNPDIYPWINRTLMFRFAAIASLSLLATLDVYRRDARSWGLIARSVVFMLPVLGALAWIKFKGLPVVSGGSGDPKPIAMIIILLGGLILGILFSIAGHFLIRSFEIALPENAEKID